MAENDFRLSGGMGIDPDPIDPHQQVMHQGIGFPLRPVDNVLPDNFPVIPDGLIAEGLFMQWMGNWQQGIYYPKGSYVRSGTYTAIANKLTLDSPAPQNIGDPAYVLPDPWVNASTASNVSVVSCNHAYLFNTTGYVQRLRIHVPAVGDDIKYRLVIVDVTIPGAPVTTTIENPNVEAGVWSVIALANSGVAPGSNVIISLESLNSSATTDIDGGWTYQGATQTGAPQPQNWTIDNQRTTFRIDKTDLDGTDRSTELENVLPESIISVVETATPGLNSQYIVTGVIDSGTYMDYAVILQNETGGGPTAGAVTTVEIDVPVPLATQYDEEANALPGVAPTWAAIATSLEYDGQDAGAPDTTMYGIDIEFQEAVVSPDWDLITTL
jgi:hypothetical protein